MHGLICRSFERFVCTAYGQRMWQDVLSSLDLGFDTFEAMFSYDDASMDMIVSSIARALSKSRDVLLEDFGTYLVTGEGAFRVRRLLRYGGVNYEDFLHSLEDLPGRAALAVPDLDLPALQLDTIGPGEFNLKCLTHFDGASHVLIGLLRALADDYGALVFLDHLGQSAGVETISIQLLQSDFAKDNGFDLSDVARAVGG